MIKKRILNFDFARTLAIIFVVMSHSIETIYINSPNTLTFRSNLLESILFFISRLGVPLFLFLTGSLIIKKEFKNKEDINKFYKTNLLPLVISTEIFNIIYYIFLCLIYKTNFDILECVKYLLFIKQVGMCHMWYMPMIIGIYISLPFLTIILKKFDINNFKWIVYIFIFYMFLIPTINPFLSLLKTPEFGHILNINLLGSFEVLYIILGYYLYEKKILRKISSKKIILIFLISSISGIFVQLFISKNLFNGVYYYRLWYNTLFILISSVTLFELILRFNLNNKIINSFCLNVSKYAFSIFLIHEIIIILYNQYFNIKNIGQSEETILLFIITFILSFVISAIISKTKKIRKLFLIK